MNFSKNRRKSGKFQPTLYILLEIVGMLLILEFVKLIPFQIIHNLAIIGVVYWVATSAVRRYIDRLTRDRDIIQKS